MNYRVFIKQHLGWILFAGMALIFGWQTYRSGKAVAKAEIVDASARAQISQLQAQMTARDVQVAAQVKAVQIKAAAVKTPAQAIAAMLDVFKLPHGFRPNPLNPTEYVLPAIDAPSLYQQGADAQMCFIKLAGCQDNLAHSKKIVPLEESRVRTWRDVSGSGKWNRLKNCAARVGVGTASGAAGAGVQNARNGAIIGASIGVASCFIFR